MQCVKGNATTRPAASCLGLHLQTRSDPSSDLTLASDQFNCSYHIAVQKEEATKEEAAPPPAEPTAEATGDATKQAVPEDGASVPSKVDIEEIPADDSSAPMESSVNDMD